MGRLRNDLAPGGPHVYAVTVTVTNRFGSTSLSMAVEVPLVVAWGDNAWAQSAVPLGLANVIAVATGFGHSLALTIPHRENVECLLLYCVVCLVCGMTGALLRQYRRSAEPTRSG